MHSQTHTTHTHTHTHTYTHTHTPHNFHCFRPHPLTGAANDGKRLHDAMSSVRAQETEKRIDSTAYVKIIELTDKLNSVKVHAL